MSDQPKRDIHYKFIDVSETQNVVTNRRLAKLEAEVAELREELEILASRLGHQEM